MQITHIDQTREGLTETSFAATLQLVTTLALDLAAAAAAAADIGFVHEVRPIVVSTAG
ncbi:MAG: hypothetical protein KF773_14125 [Deltaproteobacteria bacterium]|nr:hypothetical protein [Deltaproteobacteria bacterium]